MWGFSIKRFQALDVPGVCAYPSLSPIKNFETNVGGAQFGVAGK